MTNNNDLMFRIECIYEAIGDVEETDIGKFKPNVIKEGNRVGIYQDWSGELNDAQRTNYLESLITNIANFEYYLNKWVDNNKLEKAKVKDAFNRSQALKIVHELWNNAKHAGLARESKSGLYPRIDKINTIMRMTTKSEKGSPIAYTLNLQGDQKIIGNGNAKVIITGDILDRDGNKIGDLYETLLKAIDDWEKVLSDFGVK